MHIFIKTLGGVCLPLTYTKFDSIESVKDSVECITLLPADLVKLRHGGLQLNSGNLDENGIEDGDTLDVNLSIFGGMRAKWRKKRMRRLRRKRRKMRQRAR